MLGFRKKLTRFKAKVVITTMSDPVFRMAGSFIELEYPGVATKYVRRDMVNSISSSPFRVSISLMGTDGIKPTESLLFATKEGQANFLAGMIASFTEPTTPNLLVKVNKTMTDSINLITERMRTFKEDLKSETQLSLAEMQVYVNSETQINVEAMRALYDEIKERLDSLETPKPEAESEPEAEPEPEKPEEEVEPDIVCDICVLFGVFVFTLLAASGFQRVLQFATRMS